jgi:hypothetical protein
VTSKIGSHAKWEVTNNDVYNHFAATGDLIRTSLPDLEAVINAGVRTVLYDGDADFIVNFMGVEAMVRVLQLFTRICCFSPFALTGLCVRSHRLPPLTQSFRRSSQDRSSQITPSMER